MFTGRRPFLLIAGGSTLCCLLLLGLSGRRLLAGQKEASGHNWTVAGTKPTEVEHVQYSASNVIPCRVVSFRSKNESLDPWGKLAVYPVVKAPDGKIYRGFVREYEASGIGSRWIKWTFPTSVPQRFLGGHDGNQVELWRRVDRRGVTAATSSRGDLRGEMGLQPSPG